MGFTHVSIPHLHWSNTSSICSFSSLSVSQHFWAAPLTKLLRLIQLMGLIPVARPRLKLGHTTRLIVHGVWQSPLAKEIYTNRSYSHLPLRVTSFPTLWRRLYRRFTSNLSKEKKWLLWQRYTVTNKTCMILRILALRYITSLRGISTSCISAWNRATRKMKKAPSILCRKAHYTCTSNL